MAVLTSFRGSKPANISHRPKPHEVTRCLMAIGLFNSFRDKCQQHVVTLDAHCVGFRLHAAPRDAGTANHVKLPAMQRTGYNAAFQTTLPQRPATMQATVVDGMQSPGDIEQRNLLALYFHNLGGPGRNVADSTRLYKLNHAFYSSLFVDLGQSGDAGAMNGSENPCSQSTQELERIDAGVVAIAEGDPVSIVANWFNSLDTQRPCLGGRQHGQHGQQRRRLPVVLLLALHATRGARTLVA